MLYERKGKQALELTHELKSQLPHISESQCFYIKNKLDKHNAWHKPGHQCCFFFFNDQGKTLMDVSVSCTKQKSLSKKLNLLGREINKYPK